MSDKYNERVRALAKEMLRSFKGYKQDTPIDGWEWWFYKDEYTDYARIAVAHMAELARNWMNAYAWAPPFIEEYLKEQGLIPDSPQENKPEPCPQELRCATRNHPEGTCDCHNMGLLPQQEGGNP